MDLPYETDYDVYNLRPQSHYERSVGHYEILDAISFAPPNTRTLNLGFQHMDQTPDGWCSKLKGYWLMNFIYLKKPKVIVEIGVWGGKSLIPMARALQELGEGGVAYGIDPWKADASVIGMDPANEEFWKNQQAHERIYQELKARVEAFGLGKTIRLIRDTSEHAPIIHNIDILHIDGNHSEDMALLDAVKWVPEVVPGGLIFLDDITWTIHGKPSVAKTVEWLDEHCIRLTLVPDVDNAWGIWVKK